MRARFEGLAERQTLHVVALPCSRKQDLRRKGPFVQDATVFEPTGLVAAQVEGRDKVLVHQIDLSFAVLGWSAHLHEGRAFRDKYGDRAGYHYEPREDLGMFWSNDPATPVGEMVRALGLEEIDVQIARNRRLQDAARGGPAR